MECFKCKCQLYQNKSEFGFYYKCPKCGKIFETTGQIDYNSKKYKNRKDAK